LPEPLPVATLPQSKIDLLKQDIIGQSRSLPDTTSPLFKDAKEAVFRRMCEGLTVEQALARHHAVFQNGLASANLPITADDVRARAESIGTTCTPGRVVETIADPRLFREWIHAVINHIAAGHFEYGVRVCLDVPHLDTPCERPDEAWLGVQVEDIPASDDPEEYETKEACFMVKLYWPGRLAIKEQWAEYIMYLMRTICDLSV